MKLKDLEKIKLLETALMLGVMVGIPTGMLSVAFFSGDPEIASLAKLFEEATSLLNDNNNLSLYTFLSMLPRITDSLLSSRIEPTTEDYKQIKILYNNVVSNLANFLKEQNITDPAEIFVAYQFMFRNGYISYNHNFNYDYDMKDLRKLGGADVIRGTGVCRSISAFLTDLYKEMGYDSFNLLVNANDTILENIDKQGDYPKWKINKKTNKLVKIISKSTEFANFSNHLITAVEKDGKIYVFDPTNDALLIKGKNNKLILPNGKKGRMKIACIVNCMEYVNGNLGNLKLTPQIYKQLKNDTIDYEDYQKIYKNTLNYIKNNVLLFEEFYHNNESLYSELFEKINNVSSLIKRNNPELLIIESILNTIKERLQNIKERTQNKVK